jgi:hypothetical protein
MLIAALDYTTANQLKTLLIESTSLSEQKSRHNRL